MELYGERVAHAGRQDQASELFSYVHTIISYQAQFLSQLIIPPSVVDAITLITGCCGRIVCTGLGKSGIVARKFAATLSSIGVAALFLHAADALHGDLGVLAHSDVLCVFTKSGISRELSIICMTARDRQVPIICFSSVYTDLAACAQVHIRVPCGEEAGDVPFVPTTSVLGMLALGDAIALAVARQRGVTAASFAQNHPGGVLGATVGVCVAQRMRTHDLPLIAPTATFLEVLTMLSDAGRGVCIVVDARNASIGIITDGDIRRACAQGAALFSATAQDIMTCDPIIVSPQMPIATALEIMETRKITSLIVEDQRAVVGHLHIHDIVGRVQS